MPMRIAKPALADGSSASVRLRWAPTLHLPTWPLVLIAFISPLLFLVLKLAYWPVIEAPGYIVPGTPELHVAAYVPQSHVELAKPGQEAMVLFPDGERKLARITDVAQAAAREVPLSEPHGHTPLGVLVRMDLVDSSPSADERKDGLPVRIRFPKRW